MGCCTPGQGAVGFADADRQVVVDLAAEEIATDQVSP